jgi:hypothetical protein
MAFLKDNFFVEGNSEDAFFSRTNPLANAANAEILKVEECGDCGIELVVEITTAGGTTSINFDAPTSTYADLIVLNTQFTDGKGNFATAAGNASLDTSALDSTQTWTATVSVQIREGGILGCACSKKFNFSYNPADGIQIDTREIGIGILRASATEGGTYNLTTIAAGAFPDGGTSEDFDFYVKNIGVNALRIATVTVTGDVLTAVIDTTLLGGDTLFAGNIRNIAITIDSSGAVGSYSGTVIFTYTDGSTETITITYTLA